MHSLRYQQQLEGQRDDIIQANYEIVEEQNSQDVIENHDEAND